MTVAHPANGTASGSISVNVSLRICDFLLSNDDDPVCPCIAFLGLFQRVQSLTRCLGACLCRSGVLAALCGFLAAARCVVKGKHDNEGDEQRKGYPAKPWGDAV